ncbi:hypothetical protein AGABI2DRAFT_116122 [Agaricus bisporus var. bisporus H97]|uniref:hypothetical protein n=1 Tax=Agaricus bisporus var. bisporus (strain H97 / ATCC MYA-4626 / FGSC 10389) TaxID=936046 RepID=UPI00029F6459|nr:hypothetical protein AGABI2DRAFT_116122 [Agaricus bisporus var. bisporus H97]EKV49083.1 hypothetical protein AGABI2DRAFT_116122 [Agaricus bisporus var. bisporus H97]
MIKELLERFNMDDANPLSTPLAPGSELSDIVPSLEEQAEMKSVPYLNAVGALQYLATMTCPDIAYAVSYLGRFNSNQLRLTGLQSNIYSVISLALCTTSLSIELVTRRNYSLPTRTPLMEPARLQVELQARNIRSLNHNHYLPVLEALVEVP